jgi:hypothetical protein
MNIYHDVLPSVVTPCQMAEAMYRLKQPMHVPMQNGFGITFIEVSGYAPSMAEMVPTTLWKTITELDFVSIFNMSSTDNDTFRESDRPIRLKWSLNHKRLGYSCPFQAVFMRQ